MLIFVAAIVICLILLFNFKFHFWESNCLSVILIIKILSLIGKCGLFIVNISLLSIVDKISLFGNFLFLFSNKFSLLKFLFYFIFRNFILLLNILMVLFCLITISHGTSVLSKSLSLRKLIAASSMINVGFLFLYFASSISLICKLAIFLLNFYTIMSIGVFIILFFGLNSWLVTMFI